MTAQDTRRIDTFQNDVAIKFQLYNSLFLSLPFLKIEKTGILLSLLLSQCEEGFANGKTTIQILDNFLDHHTEYPTEKERTDLLFRFIQYIERQIVLFDALEDAAYDKINDLKGTGTIKQLESVFENLSIDKNTIEKLDNFCVRLVLTAHPTQFYPGSVLGIINDLAESLKLNNTEAINLLLQQLGKTAFLNRQKPTPYDEAVSLIWYLENVFYHSIGKILSEYKVSLPFMDNEEYPLVKMGFWPGGDRDGNPFVTAETTYRVAESLHIALMRSYYRDIRKLRRRLTFKGVDSIIIQLETALYDQAFKNLSGQISHVSQLIEPLLQVKEILQKDYNNLFQKQVDDLISKMYCFGIHFAFVDIRQEDAVHRRLIEAVLSDEYEAYHIMSEDDKISFLRNKNTSIKDFKSDDAIFRDTIDTMDIVKKIQSDFGEAACHRYIISQCNSALNIIEVMTLFEWSGWDKHHLTMDIVPLFETIEDLINATSVMRKLYEMDFYREHLQRRKNTQTIMVGFSDGTKDGGYLMANWMIYKAKMELSKLSEQYGVRVLFFDGRGGPPARGGGKTHKFYASMGKNIANQEIQLTIQGQTVSSNFGVVESARYNIEQMINAGISNILYSGQKSELSEEDEQLIFDMAQISLSAYRDLKNHEGFTEYMSEVSPLKYFGMTNIGSRPVKRGQNDKLTIKDLRAIPFVGSWTMIKQNVPGFYGIGSALQVLDKKGKLGQLKNIYKHSLFFRTLMDNSEMALFKTYMPMTKHISSHPEYGSLWNKINDEYLLTQKYILTLGSNTMLMQSYPVDRLSIQMRERITLPLTSIQQYALHKLRDEYSDEKHELYAVYQKIVFRCAFGIINAGRNSA